MQRLVALSVVSLSLLACSGNAVVEPGSKTSKRAKAFIEKCQVETPPDAPADLKEVYACIAPESGCPAAGDAETITELGYVLDKGDSSCQGGTAVFDVPCGPDLNAVDCCYVARVYSTTGGCD